MALIPASKLPGVGTTIFTVMSELAVKHNAVNLGQGFPDFDVDEQLIQCVHEVMRNQQNQYTHMNGLPVLRERIAEKINKLYHANVDSVKNITITPGATYGLYTAFTAILNPGDEVILFSPAYDSYIPNIEINGGIVVEIPLAFPDYTPDWDLVRSKISNKTRAIILNTPHNPTGAVWSKKDFEQLEKIIAGTNIIVVSDEVYEHIVFDGLKHHSVLESEILRNQSFAVYSFGKTFSCTGWKLGYVVAPETLMQEFRKVHQFNCFTCNTPMQAGIAAYMQDPSTYNGLSAALQSKRDLLLTLMEPTRFKPLESHGSYFQLFSYEEISDLPEYEFAVSLVEKAGVATIPLSSFYSTPPNNKVLRFCFSKKNEVLEEAARRLTGI